MATIDQLRSLTNSAIAEKYCASYDLLDKIMTDNKDNIKKRAQEGYYDLNIKLKQNDCELLGENLNNFKKLPFMKPEHQGFILWSTKYCYNGGNMNISWEKGFFNKFDF